MQADRIRWNKKYREDRHPARPASIVKRYHRRARPKRALDLACGNGRNALFLADQGFTVDAVDISDIGMQDIPRRPKELHLICADLGTFDIPGMRYDLICNIRYLNRRLFPYILEGLVPGGVLIFETCMEETAKKPKSISCRDHLLRPNELLHAFISLRILCYAETREKKGDAVAALVGVKGKRQEK